MLAGGGLDLVGECRRALEVVVVVVALELAHHRVPLGAHRR